MAMWGNSTGGVFKGNPPSSGTVRSNLGKYLHWSKRATPVAFTEDLGPTQWDITPGTLSETAASPRRREHCPSVAVPFWSMPAMMEPALT